MEHRSKGIVFALARETLGVTVIIKEVPPAGLPNFSQQDIQAIVGHFNSHPLPPEISSPKDYPSYRANLLIVTEAMVANAIEETARKLSTN